MSKPQGLKGLGMPDDRMVDGGGVSLLLHTLQELAMWAICVMARTRTKTWLRTYLGSKAQTSRRSKISDPA